MTKVTAREFQRRFGKLVAALKPGEGLTIVRNGKVDGIYRKLPERKIPFPDFMKRLEQHDYSEATGDALLRTLDAAVS
jgi:hypothetical protein